MAAFGDRLRMSTAKQPTSEQCSANAVVDENEDFVRFAAWHPQWGGYVGKCIVEIGKTTNSSDDSPGCYEVWNWHDGEFPSDNYVDHKHYCSPEQLILFAVEIMEKAAQYQRTDEGKPVAPDLDDLIVRMRRLAENQGT